MDQLTTTEGISFFGLKKLVVEGVIEIGVRVESKKFRGAGVKNNCVDVFPICVKFRKLFKTYDTKLIERCVLFVELRFEQMYETKSKLIL